MTVIYQAVSSHFSLRQIAAWDFEKRPLSLLVSFAYLSNWRRFRSQHPSIKPLRTMLDSGAFTAFNRGTAIDIEALARETMTGEWTESVALDVIGDADGSYRNAVRMKELGSTAFPVFHIGEPWELLARYCEGWDKVGLSCRFGEPYETSHKFYAQAFARQWPHKFHSFGWVQQEALQSFPFHSADAATTTLTAINRLFAFKGKGRFMVKRSLPGVPTDLAGRGQELMIMRFLDLERHLRDAWAKELAVLEAKR